MIGVLDISPVQHEEIERLLELHLPGMQVWVFGSRITGNARSNSDLDMVVFASSNQSRQVHDLREAFDESNLPFRVDVLVWDDLPASFQENIKRRNVTFEDAD